MSKIYRVIILLMMSVNAGLVMYGQEKKLIAGLQSVTKADIGLQGIGFSYERRFGSSVVSSFSAGAGGGYAVNSSSVKYEFTKPAFYMSVTPKYFYNIRNRLNKGRSVEFNSGNYIGFRIKYVMPFRNDEALSRSSIISNLHWGMQRKISKQLLLTSHAGIGYGYDTDSGSGMLHPSLGLDISFVF